MKYENFLLHSLQTKQKILRNLLKILKFGLSALQLATKKRHKALKKLKIFS